MKTNKWYFGVFAFAAVGCFVANVANGAGRAEYAKQKACDNIKQSIDAKKAKLTTEQSRYSVTLKKIMEAESELKAAQAKLSEAQKAGTTQNSLIDVASNSLFVDINSGKTNGCQ